MQPKFKCVSHMGLKLNPKFNRLFVLPDLNKFFKFI